jgi:hypothetical protein
MIIFYIHLFIFLNILLFFVIPQNDKMIMLPHFLFFLLLMILIHLNDAL